MSTKLKLALAVISATVAAATNVQRRADYTSVCKQIAGAISSSSDVYYPGGILYTKDIGHWMTSSTEQAACSVEPGTAEDVGTILQIINSTQTPFAVKGAGHASNPGFSSTEGVQIAMYRFSEVNYHSDSSTADIGAGLIWDDVYAALEPYNVVVVGGRVTGVGVAGFTLGGGYSWLTNQYGLTVDTVTAFELVLPNGTVTTVTENTYPDLMFGLKGGFNNFGIVTKFTLQTYPQGQVWGGLITFTEDQIPAVVSAVANFSANVTDTKAGVISAFNYLVGAPGVSQILFYDGETPPDGIFDDFLSIPSFTKDVQARSYISMVQASPANATAGQRGIFNTVSLLDYPSELLDAIVNETEYWGSTLSLKTGTFISYDVEPFRPSLFSHSSASSSAYPPSRSQAYLPLNLYYAYGDEGQDETFYDAVRQSRETILNKAVSLGQDVASAPLYGNYAIFDTPVESIYGSDHLSQLRSLKAQYDPDNVMALAGGFKISA